MTRSQVRASSDEVGSDERTITVQIIAASPMVRAGLAALIGADERYQVWGSFSSVIEAGHEIEFVSEKPPDVIIVELGKTSGNDVADLTKSQEADPSPAVVALISDWQPESVASLLRSGTRAVLPSTASGEEIIATLEATVAGLIVIHSDALEVLDEMATTKEVRREPSPFVDKALTESLTPRERQVLGLIAEGLGNKEIAWQLQISEHTVKFHVSSILAKLGSSSRTEAVTQGLRRGLIMM